MDEHLVHDDLREDGRGEAKQLQQERGEKDFTEQSAIWNQERQETPEGRLRFFDAFEFHRRRQEQQITCPTLFKLRPRQPPPPDARVGDDDVIRRRLVEHDVMVALPMRDGGQVHFEQVIVSGADAARVKAQPLRALGHAVERRAFAAHVD